MPCRAVPCRRRRRRRRRGKLDLIVLHYDADFDRMATVTGQRSRWVVPAGSVE